MTQHWPDDETLLGYLLGGLSQEEADAVLEALRENTVLQDRLALLAERIGPLQTTDESIEVPPDLASRVFDSIDRVEADLAPKGGMVEAGDAEGRGVAGTPMGAFDRLNGSCELGFERVPGSNGWLNVLAATAASLVLISLLMPSVLSSRELARREICADHLRQLGFGLQAFANCDPVRRIPSIELSGRLGFSGIYAIRLRDYGLLEGSNLLWCPSISESPPEHGYLLSADQLMRCDSRLASICRRNAGGSYAFNLGCLNQGVYQTPQWMGRSWFAILADSPVTCNSSNRWLAHSGYGVNVLYEDGRIAFLRLDQPFQTIDHPFFNRNGLREAGLDLDDSTLGPSALPPMKSVEGVRRKAYRSGIVPYTIPEHY